MAALPDYVSDARMKADQAGQALQGYAGKEYTIADELKKVLNDVTAEGKKDWADIRGKTLSDYLASPAIARSMYMNPDSPQNIFDPVQANRVMTEHIQGDEIPFFSANTLFGMMQGGEKELIDSGTNAFKAQSAAAQAAYNAARQTYQDVFQEFTTLDDIRRADEQLALERLKVSKTGSGSAADNEIKQIIKEAGQLPEEERKQYIIDQGYNPSGASFTGLFTPAVDWADSANQAKIYEGSNTQYTIDPSTGKVTPKEDPRYGSSKFWPEFFGAGPFGKYEDKYLKNPPKK